MPASGSFTDGTGESISVPYEAELQLPVPVREGYGFDGWYEADQKFTDGMMPAGNISLKAKWIAGQYGYTINHYLQKEDGSDSYMLKDTVYGTAEVCAHTARSFFRLHCFENCRVVFSSEGPE